MPHPARRVTSRRRAVSLADPNLYHDLFTDPDGTLLTAHLAITGQGYACNSAGNTIQGNQATNSTDAAYHPCVWDALKADLDLAYDVTLGTVGAGVYSAPAVVLRYQDDNNFWMYQAHNGTIFLYERNAGSFILRASAVQAMATGQVHTMRMTAAGNVITCYWDGVQQLTFTSASFNSKTKHGFVSVKTGAPAAFSSYDNGIGN